MHPIMFGSRMAKSFPLSVKRCECLGLGCRNLWFPLPPFVVNLNSLVVCFGSGSSFRQLLRVDTLVGPLSVAPVQGLGVWGLGFRV